MADSIVRARKRKASGRRQNALTYFDVKPPRTPSSHGVGSKRDAAARQLANRASKPLNDRATDLLARLTTDPQRACDLGKAMGLTRSQLQSSASCLTQRGLARKTPNGWVLDATP